VPDNTRRRLPACSALTYRQSRTSAGWTSVEPA